MHVNIHTYIYRCLYIYIYMCVYVYIYIYIYTHICVYIHICIVTHLPVYIHICMCIFIIPHKSVCTYLPICICNLYISFFRLASLDPRGFPRANKAVLSQPYPAVTVASRSKAKRWRSKGTDKNQRLSFESARCCITYRWSCSEVSV